MAVVFENRVVESCATLGTGNFVVSGADLGYSTFAEKVPIGSTIHYLCESVNAVGRPTGEFELGRGTYVAANTISRNSVVSSSNAGALVDFTQASKRLSLTVLAPSSTVIRADWREVLGAQVEPGVIGYTAASAPPAGWLKRNGAAVSRTIYASLFAAIGTTYGAGDGTTTFNLPEGRGEFDRGWDDGRGIDVGRGRGSAQQATALRTMPVEWVGADVSSGQFNFGNPYAQADEIIADGVNPLGAVSPVGGQLMGGYADNSMKAEADGSSTGISANRWIRFRPRNVAYLPIIKY